MIDDWAIAQQLVVWQQSSRLKREKETSGLVGCNQNWMVPRLNPTRHLARSYGYNVITRLLVTLRSKLWKRSNWHWVSEVVSSIMTLSWSWDSQTKVLKNYIYLGFNTNLLLLLIFFAFFCHVKMFPWPFVKVVNTCKMHF